METLPQHPDVHLADGQVIIAPQPEFFFAPPFVTHANNGTPIVAPGRGDVFTAGGMASECEAESGHVHPPLPELSVVLAGPLTAPPARRPAFLLECFGLN